MDITTLMYDNAIMNKLRKKCKWHPGILKFFVIVICLGGFFYQMVEILLFYWTYPTFVDIQEISPSRFEMPAFSICNAIGYDIDFLCTNFGSSVCLEPQKNESTTMYVCRKYPEACIKGKLPDDYSFIVYSRILQSASITPEDHEYMRMHLEEYLNCTIEFAGTTKRCNLENVMGSFYTKDDLPQYCYTIYSIWGEPSKKRQFIQKGAIMRLHFFLNASRREFSVDEKEIPLPRHNLPTNPAVQIAVHSPHFLPSPYVDGMDFLKGRAYELSINLEETHLLPGPYRTNCTDYMKVWKQRGGKAPINQLGIVRECQLNKTYETLGCVPATFDYPHNYTICRSCDDCNYNVASEECSLLADSYNQPCDSMTYLSEKESKIITIFEELKTKYIRSTEGIRFRVIEHECSGRNFWKKECSTIDIDVLFDRFKTTKLTYHPKYERLELFSVIGGYIGIWLGISLLAVYDYLGNLLTMLKNHLQKKKLMRKSKPRRIRSKEVRGDTEYYSWHM